MTSKKKIAGFLILAAIIFVGALPIILYGVSVDVTEVGIDLGLSSTTSSSSSSISTQAVYGDYSVDGLTVSAINRQMNPYEYAFNRLGGQASASEGASSGTDIVQIQITFELTTPSGQQLTFAFNPLDLEGKVKKNFQS